MAINPELLIASPTLQDALVGKDGLPLVNGTITCYKDNNRTTLKNWYYQTGSPVNYNWLPLPNPLTLSAAGTIVDINGIDVIPFFYPWFVDEAGVNISEPYYITVKDKNGVLQFPRANFPYIPKKNPNPDQNSIYSYENYIINNRFWRNIGSVSVGTLPLTPNTGAGYIKSGDFGDAYNASGNAYYVTIAPSQNNGFSMPDINYIKNATGGNESITFKNFPATDRPVLKGDTMPEYYLEHICSSNETGVTLKCYQFPISLRADTLAGQEATVTLQARSNNGGTKLEFRLYQFLGTGNDSVASVPFQTFSLTTQFEKFYGTFVFPDDLIVEEDIAGDSAWYLQIGLPLDVPAFSFEMTLPSLYLSPQANVPTNSFKTYDQIEAIISKPRTGDVRTSLNTFYPYGWVPMSDGTIGKTDSNATARNNIDTWPLFSMLWSLFKKYDVSGINPVAQMYKDDGTSVAYGDSAILDWQAKKAISLTRSMGQVLMGTVPMTALIKQYQATFTASQLVASGSGAITFTANAGTWLVTVASLPVTFGEVVSFTGTMPTNIVANNGYYATPFNSAGTVFHLSTSLANAKAGVFVASGGGAGSALVMTTRSLVLTTANALSLFVGMPFVVTNENGTLPGGMSTNTIYYAAPCSATTLCLALSFNDAITGSLVAYSSAGTPTNTITCSFSGASVGEYNHLQQRQEVGVHGHKGTATATFTASDLIGDGNAYAVYSSRTPIGSKTLNSVVTINDSTPNLAANVTQPSTFNNVYIKL